MRVSVDKGRCQGHARCHAVNPDLFPLDDVGFSALASAEVPPGWEADARAAVNNCPEMALTIEE